MSTDKFIFSEKMVTPQVEPKAKKSAFFWSKILKKVIEFLSNSENRTGSFHWTGNQTSVYPKAC